MFWCGRGLRRWCHGRFFMISWQKALSKANGSACGRGVNFFQCSGPMKFSEAEIRRRAVKGLLHEVPLKHERSDDDMNAVAPMIPAGVKAKPAAVLVPIVLREPEVPVLPTQRTDHLSSPGAQGALPRGAP